MVRRRERVRIDQRQAFAAGGAEGTVTAMAIRAEVARAVLLTALVGLAGTGNSRAQAAGEAAAAGAASSSAGGAAKSTGKALGSVLGGVGAGVDSSTKTSAPGGSAGSTSSAPAEADPGRGVDAIVAPPPEVHFDVVSFQRCAAAGSFKVDVPVDGDSVKCHCQPVSRILTFAYSSPAASEFRMTGAPAWVSTDLYNFEADVAHEDLGTWLKFGLEQRKAALRKLLADALKLKARMNATPKPVYTLSVAESGPKLKKYTQGEQERLPNGLLLVGRDTSWVGWTAYFQDNSMGDLAESLSEHLDRPVLDQTGLTGTYVFSLPLPHGSRVGANEGVPSVAESVSALGLKLAPGKTLVDGLLVQHIEPPRVD
jgi:uncharacterized protein (TIGR03435 family)